MTSTGKRARKRYGNRYAAKRVGNRVARTKRTGGRRKFGALPFCALRKTAEGFVRDWRPVVDSYGGVL